MQLDNLMVFIVWWTSVFIWYGAVFLWLRAGVGGGGGGGGGEGGSGFWTALWSFHGTKKRKQESEEGDKRRLVRCQTTLLHIAAKKVGQARLSTLEWRQWWETSALHITGEVLLSYIQSLILRETPSSEFIWGHCPQGVGSLLSLVNTFLSSSQNGGCTDPQGCTRVWPECGGGLLELNVCLLIRTCLELL